MLMVMANKRSKTHSGKVTARLPDALKGDYRAWIQKHGDAHKYFNRRMGIEQCTAALVDFFMRGLTEAERHELLKKWLPDVQAQEEADWEQAAKLADIGIQAMISAGVIARSGDTGLPSTTGEGIDASGVGEVPIKKPKPKRKH